MLVKMELKSNYIAFDPVLVFQKLYKKTFTNVCTTLFPNNHEIFLRIWEKIEEMFYQQALDNINKSITTANAHKAMLARFP